MIEWAITSSVLILAVLALRRLLKCHPFHRQKSIEYDPVP